MMGGGRGNEREEMRPPSSGSPSIHSPFTPLYIPLPTQVRTWRAHKLPVSDMAIDASGGFVATASADRSVKVWDLQGGFCTHSFTGHSGVVLRVIFHPKQVWIWSVGHVMDPRVHIRGLRGLRGLVTVLS